MATANYKSIKSTTFLGSSSVAITFPTAATGDVMILTAYTEGPLVPHVFHPTHDWLLIGYQTTDDGVLSVWARAKISGETYVQIDWGGHSLDPLYGCAQIIVVDDAQIPYTTAQNADCHFQPHTAGTASYTVPDVFTGDVVLATRYDKQPPSSYVASSGFTSPTGYAAVSGSSSSAGLRVLLGSYKEIGSSGSVATSLASFNQTVDGYLITLVVRSSAAPVVSPAEATIIEDDGGTVQIVATRSPTSYAAVSGLVTGITLNTSTGVITVADTVDAGTYSIVVTATNGSGTSEQATIVIHVVALTLATDTGTVRVWRGDSSTGAVSAKKLVYTSDGSASVIAAVTATINGHSFEVEWWTPTKFADAWNASDLQEFSEITATAGTNSVLLTADDEGRDFTVELAFGDGTSETFVIDDIARPLGPAVWSDPRNWRDENDEIGVPGSGDKIIINRKCTISEGLVQWCGCTLSEDEEWLILDTAFPSFVLNQRVTLNANGADHATAYFIRAVKNNMVQIGLAPDAPADMPSWIGAGSYDAGEVIISARPAEFDCRAETGNSVIGLPRHQKGGALEYRPRHLRLECTGVNVGNGDGQGPGQLFLDLGQHKSNMIIFGSGTQSGWQASIDLLANSNETNITIAGGQLGVAVDPTSTSVVRRITAYGGQVLLGKQAVWTYLTEAFKAAFKRWV